jgi:hypothetical protein
MNNFLRWKKELTAKKALDIFRNTGCYKCPAEDVCKRTTGCEKAFKEWAESEIKCKPTN